MDITTSVTKEAPAGEWDTSYADDPLLTVPEAAKYLAVGKTKFNELAGQKFPVVRFMGDKRVRRSDLNKFIAMHLVRNAGRAQ
jgi:excisionase family DNA binding protein